MGKTLKIRDLTLRDGQQSLFETRMTQEQIDRVLPLFREAGFYALEVWGVPFPKWQCSIWMKTHGRGL